MIAAIGSRQGLNGKRWRSSDPYTKSNNDGDRTSRGTDLVLDTQRLTIPSRLAIVVG
jgi:hypothetical protein